MLRTITAMFENRSEAETAREQLRTQLGAEARIIDQSSVGSSEDTGESRGFWADLKDMFVSEDDRPSYEEGVRRGHFLLCANMPEEQADRACSLLEGGSVDLEQREQQWRSDGWAGHAGIRQTSGSDSRRGERGIVEEERIPVVEEQLRVGKRETQRGGARVRSYVEEQPVTENVNLRAEQVNVERRPVDQPISARDADDKGFFQDRSVEMQAKGEEAVVGKEARVKEEVVVQKSADERTEQVQDTVRNTNVEVDKEPRDRSGGAFGFDGNRKPNDEGSTRK